MENLLTAVGYPKTTFEDWTEETFNLLTQIANEVSGSERGASSVLGAFNDQEIMSSIIMHFRVSPPSC